MGGKRSVRGASFVEGMIGVAVAVGVVMAAVLILGASMRKGSARLGACIGHFGPGCGAAKASVAQVPGATMQLASAGPSCDRMGHCTGLGNCFVAGTPVLTEAGLRPIETIAVGDHVLAEDLERGIVVSKRAVRTFVRQASSLVTVRVEQNGKVEAILATPEHPFHVAQRGWVSARDLAPGDPLTAAHGHARVVGLLSSPAEAGGTQVFNFEVEDAHDYFVGEAAALVHNECDGTPPATFTNVPKGELAPPLRFILDSIPKGTGAGGGLGLADFADPAKQKTMRRIADAAALAVGVVDVGPMRVASVKEMTIPGPGGPIPVRVYTPENVAPNKPGVVLFHGGAFIIGDPASYDRMARFLAAGSQATVVVPAYRLAPEHPFPAAHDDADATWDWVMKNGAQIGIDPANVAVAGDSAGGNLAASVSLRARDNQGPAPKAQILMYPWLDPKGDTGSKRDLAEGYFISAKDINLAAGTYLGGHSPADPRVAPLHAASTKDLPPAVVMTGGFDPLKDEGAGYVKRLQDAGVPVKHIHYPSMIHGFAQLGGITTEGTDVLWQSVYGIRSNLGVTGELPKLAYDMGEWQKQQDQILGSLLDVAASTLNLDANEKQMLWDTLLVIDELAGADRVINYGDQDAIASALASDSPGIVETAHEQIDLRTGRIVGGIAHNLIDKTYTDTRTGPRGGRGPVRRIVQNSRENLRGKISDRAYQEAIKLFGGFMQQAGVDPRTASQVDGKPRNLSIADMKRVEATMKMLQQKAAAKAGGAGLDMQALLTQMGPVGKGGNPIAGGIPSPRDPLAVQALMRKLSEAQKPLLPAGR